MSKSTRFFPSNNIHLFESYNYNDELKKYIYIYKIETHDRARNVNRQMIMIAFQQQNKQVKHTQNQ